MDVASVLRCQSTEVENLGREARAFHHLARHFDQAVALRALPWARMLAARRAVDQENMPRTNSLVFDLRCIDGSRGLCPVVRQILVRISVAWSRLVGAGRLAGVGVAIPCRARNSGELALQAVERRVN